MLNSKALKDTPKRFMKASCGCQDECKPECGFIVRVFHSICRFVMFKIYYPIENFFRYNKERLKRSYDYARFGWLNYDWDITCAWDLFGFKLKRLYKCLENGHSIQAEEDMKALKELIKIVGRLRRGRYGDIYYRQMDKRWGKFQSRTTPNYDHKGNITTYTWHSWREKCPEDASEELKARERNDMKCCWENGEKDRAKDLDRMKEILVKHGLSFWD